MGDIAKKIERGIMSIFRQVISPIEKMINFIIDGIDGIIEGVNCLLALVSFIIELFSYIFKFLGWFFTAFLPWIGQYIECAFMKITNITKCFPWYALDCFIWVVCLPFRLLLWLMDAIFNIGIEQIIHDYFWCPLEDLDKFIHDEEGLGTGVHIIHFPDSVMETCYECKTTSFPPMPCAAAIEKKYQELVHCGNVNYKYPGSSCNPCKKKLQQYQNCGNSKPQESAKIPLIPLIPKI